MRRSFGSCSRRGPQNISTLGSTIQARQTGGNLTRTSSLRIYQPSALPDNMFIKFKYADGQVITALGPLMQIDYTGNGMVDPNELRVGSVNPLGFIEWMAFYARYRVFGSKATYRIYNRLPTVGVFFTLFPSFLSTTIVDFDNASVQPFAITGVMGTETGGSNIANLNAYMSTKKLFGDNIFSGSFQGTVSSNPSALWHWTLFLISQDDATNPEFDYTLEILYYAKLFDRIALNQRSSPAERVATLERAARAGVLVSAAEMNTNENPPPKDQMAIPPTPSPPPIILKKQAKMLPLDLGPPALGPNGTVIISDDDVDVLMVDLKDAASDPSIDKLLI